MFRLVSRTFFQSSVFYHPCRFSFPVDSLPQRACLLSYYIELYRLHGHHYAKLDPLGLYLKKDEQLPRPTDVGIKFDQKISSFEYQSQITKNSSTIEDLETNLKAIYTDTVGVQFSHLTLFQEKDWLYEHYEQVMMENIQPGLKTRLATGLIEAQALEHFIHKKFITFKRYSGEGAESTIVALQHLFQSAAEQGFQHIVLGMTHRGRLSLLTNVLDYQGRYLFRKIAGQNDSAQELNQMIDDVVSHIAHSTLKKYEKSSTRITMVHNPSHLQAQNPVSMGKTRSKQLFYGKEKALNVQVHGDAAFCAQGIVFESLLLGKTPNYNVDGTIHIITNNQIGYTTRPIDSRGSKYSSDVCKAFDIPIIHVNGEDIESVYKVVKLAVQYRQIFKKDILIDIVCYRKYGHNQVDEPQFTQPLMYQQIRKKHTPSPLKYCQQLVKDQVLPSNFYQHVSAQYQKKMAFQFQESKNIKSISITDYRDTNKMHGPKAFTMQWSAYKPSQFGNEKSTGFDIHLLKEFAKASTYYPAQFVIHPRLKKYHIEGRLKMIENNSLDWATCEALAFFSLNYEGYNIRMTGQDVQRGTFSQRHLNLTHQQTEQTFNPLEFFAAQRTGRGKVQILNSALSENGAMSFQYGFSLDHPHNLAIWEAQFGDFYNTAQVVVDTFITNSQSKWLRQNGLVLLLPHGFDGAGPEHSSCRMERFLQLANTDGSLPYLNLKHHDPNRPRLTLKDDYFYENIQDANFSLISPTKPANLFHALRRQMLRDFRKPLVISGPKNLLRLSGCHSSFQDLSLNSKFQPILHYYNCEKVKDCEAIFLIAGKYVYDVLNFLKAKSAAKTCLLAIEEIYPFPEQNLTDFLCQASCHAQVYWLQEENLHGGAYHFVANRIGRAMKKAKIEKQLRYVGRRTVSAVAVGSSKLHKMEQEQLNSLVNELIV